jgi:hypothetical protein
MGTIFSLSRFLFSATCCLATYSYASENNFQKIYLQPENVLITTQGIFYFDSEAFLQTAAGLLVDSNGLYAIKQPQFCPENDKCPRDRHPWGSDCPHNCPD